MTVDTEVAMKVRLMCLIGIVLFSTLLSSQSLFEKAEEESKDRALSYELNGYLRSALFVGKVPDKSEAELKSGYGEACLRLKVRKPISFLESRAEQNFLHETLKIELLGLFNMTSEEFFLRSKLTYHLTDAFTFILGGELFTGPEGTLFGTIDSALNSIFLELKASF